VSTICIIIATILWGFWPIAHKLSLRTLNPIVVQLILSLTSTLVTVAYYFGCNKDFTKWNNNGVVWAMLAGLGTSGAMIAYSYAASVRNVSDIVTITAANPAIACIIAVAFLGESFTMNKVIGLMLIIGGTIFVGR